MSLAKTAHTPSSSAGLLGSGRVLTHDLNLTLASSTLAAHSVRCCSVAFTGGDSEANGDDDDSADAGRAHGGGGCDAYAVEQRSRVHDFDVKPHGQSRLRNEETEQEVDAPYGMALLVQPPVSSDIV